MIPLQERAAFLQDYIRIKTAHPNPEYEKAILLFEKQAQKDFLSYEKIYVSSGLPILIITLEGSDKQLPALLLNHHMDTVIAQAKEWQHNPFDGVITDQRVYGRGTQDMKAVGTCHYFALKEISLMNTQPKRTIHLSMVPDEEKGGFKGTHLLMQHPIMQKLRIGHVIDEGIPSGDIQTIIISGNERKPLQIKIEVTGAAGHGSKLLHPNPAHSLTTILHVLVLLHNESINQLTESGSCDPGLYNSFHISSIHTDKCDEESITAFNVTPAIATATIDIRVTPSYPLQQMISRIDTLVKQIPKAHWSILAMVDDTKERRITSTLKQYLTETITHHGFFSKDIVFEGASDMRFYREKGLEAVGCTPFIDPPLLHMANEYVSLESLNIAHTIFVSLLKNFCF